MIRVAPAGWSYPDWEGPVYPERRPRSFHPLRFLADFVDGMEVNSTFYAIPRAESVAKWAQLVEHKPAFRFTAKLYQGFTHGPEDEGRFELEAEAYRRGIEPLVRREKLDGLLVQFPVTFQHGPVEVRRLGRIRSLFADFDLILEVRHRSWFEPPALATLRGLHMSLAHIDLPDAWDHPPASHPPTGPIGYLRLHGRNAREWFRKGAGRDDRYNYLYPPEQVGDLARKALSIDAESDTTWVVTNNHFEGQAIANALEFKYLLSGQQPQPAPSQLIEAFPHLANITRSAGQQGLF
tara:strand:- start:1487 stop:2368 length:882 start_codon:yes stop_codon:yes gene_type:complete